MLKKALKTDKVCRIRKGYHACNHTCSRKNCVVTGPIIQRVAKHVACLDGDSPDGFSVLQMIGSRALKERNQLVSRLLQGEGADAPIAMANEFKASLPVLLAGYEPRNILKANEVGLFYEATGKRLFVLQRSDPADTKESKK